VIIDSTFMTREKISTINFDISLQSESYQNKVLRPILKDSNDKLILLTEKHLLSLNKDFSNESKAKRESGIKNLFGKNQAFRNLIKGMIVGNMDIEELSLFLEQEKEMTKRIIQMAEERFKSQHF
jgi:hypothetical protein